MDHSTAIRSKTETATPKKLNGYAVMIVDDKQVFRSVLKKILHEYKHIEQIMEAGSAKQMFKMLEKDGVKPAILFMDESLPGVNGFQATKHLLQSYPTTKVIIISIYDTLEYRALAKEAGASAFIVKKNLIEELDRVMQDIITEFSSKKRIIKEKCHE